jgi:DNA polymerase (family 10)
MSMNQAVAERLHEMGAMMDLLGMDSFRANSHVRAARAIEELDRSVEDLAKDRKALLEVQGVGQKMADKIIEFVNTGKIKDHEELKAQVPPGLLLLLKVPGLGPKTVKAMWQQCKITDVASLKKCIEDGSILTVPRMGEKQVEKIKAALAFAETSGERLWLGRAAEVAEAMVQRLKAVKGVARVEAAGSLRRGKETVGDIDILVAMEAGRDGDAGKVAEVFRTSPRVAQVLVAGDNRSSVRMGLDYDTARWKLEGKETDASAGPSIQVDLRVLPLDRWGAAMMYFTGSKDHNIRLRERALKMGMTLSDWGLFPEDGEKEPPHTRGIKPFPSATEEEVYGKLGLAWVPPEMREDRGEIELAQLAIANERTSDRVTGGGKRKGPKAAEREREPGEQGAAAADALRVIELSDIKAELHAHTKASDGSMTIEQLAEGARARGFHTIAVTDHSKSSALAGGLTVERLLQHIDAVRAAKVKGITILAGSEVDILADGTLDYPDDVLKKLDVVVVSPHSGLGQDPATATARLIKAVSNPYVHILGHPTGRLINRRPGLSPDMAALIKACVQHDVAMEINAHWMRLDLRDVHVRAAVNAGAKIAIDCDVHAPEDFDNLKFGVATARRGWVRAEMCINAWNAGRLHAWLKSKGR